MPVRTSLLRSFERLTAGRAVLASLGGIAACALAIGMAAPAAAYVVVTSDNRVYDVQVKPEVRGDLVLFQLDGRPVSLRIYDVNITKTNELNYLLDSGAGASSLTAQLRALRPAEPTDERIIASSRLHRVMDEEGSVDRRIVRGRMPADDATSFSDSPGGQRSSASRYQDRADSAASSSRDVPGRPAPRSEFEGEARRALEDAERQVRRPADEAPARMDAGDSARAADLDAEIAAEQDYLRKLTSGEMVVSDLEGEIDRSMDKIRRLQKRRDRLGSRASGRAAAAAPAESSYTPSGTYPAGSREAKWERELGELQAKLQRLRSQQAALPPGPSDEREMVDEFIGETQYSIGRLEQKLERAGSR